MTISTKRLGVLIWALIYGGLFAIGIGIALQRAAEPYGWGVAVCGAVVVAVGFVLVWVRSRMSGP